MPTEGEKFDELLSGYIDGALNEEERQIVERAAQDDVRVSQRILQLRQQAADVAYLGRKLAQQRPLSQVASSQAAASSLAASVLARAQQHASQMGLPEGHYLHGNRSSAITVHETSQASSESAVSLPNRPLSKRFVWLSGIAAAAAIVLAVLGPWRLGNSPAPVQVASQQADSSVGDSTRLEIPGDLPSRIDVGSETGKQWVGQFGPMTFVLVADVQITAAALQNRSLETILTAAGIPRVDPVLADGKILKALDDSRMIVDPAANSSQPIFLTVIRADMRDIDTALQNIWKDERNFPKVGLNMAIDARAALTREILNSAAGRLSLSESVAIPVATSDETTRMAASSPLPGSGEDVAYFSSVRRAASWGQADSLTSAGDDSMATLLLVTHLVE